MSNYYDKDPYYAYDGGSAPAADVFIDLFNLSRTFLPVVRR